MSGLRIMIVEDDAMLSALLAELLTAMGHEVCATAAGKTAAIAAAARERPGLIIIDVGLAEGDGPAAMAAIARTRPVAHVYISGGPFTEAAVAPGAVVLRKPFSDEMLADAISRALAAPRLD